MKAAVFIRRFVIPAWVGSVACYLRFRAQVSPRAEVEVSNYLKLGRGVSIASFCKVKASDGPLAIGAHTQIATGCFLAAGRGGLELGRDCLIGPNCSLVASNYSYAQLDVPLREQAHTSQGIRIGNNVQLAANCVVLDGANVGDNTILAAGSVVSGTIPPNSIATGNPAKVIFTRR